MDKTEALNIAQKYADTVKCNWEKEFEISNPFVNEIMTYGKEIIPEQPASAKR